MFILNSIVFLCTPNFLTSFINIFFPKSTKHFPFIIRDGYDALPFCAKNLSIFFYDISSICRFLYIVGFLVQLFYVNRVIVNKGINQLLLFYFFFIESFCVISVLRTLHSYKKKITAIPKIQNVLCKQRCDFVERKRVLLCMIKSCKSTLSQAFL